MTTHGAHDIGTNHYQAFTVEKKCRGKESKEERKGNN